MFRDTDRRFTAQLDGYLGPPGKIIKIKSASVQFVIDGLYLVG
jgi:hypothetical protein